MARITVYISCTHFQSWKARGPRSLRYRAWTRDTWWWWWWYLGHFDTLHSTLAPDIWLGPPSSSSNQRRSFIYKWHICYCYMLRTSGIYGTNHSVYSLSWQTVSSSRTRQGLVNILIWQLSQKLKQQTTRNQLDDSSAPDRCFWSDVCARSVNWSPGHGDGAIHQCLNMRRDTGLWLVRQCRYRPLIGPMIESILAV